MISKNQIIEIEITGMTSEGNGVGHAQGMAVFVPCTAIGDKLEVKIVKVLKSYAYGIIEKILISSPDRTQSDCPVSQKCGGCMFRHITYEAELKIKSGFISDAFKRIGGFDLEYESIAGCEETDFYRNKAQYPVAMQDSKAVCGFYSRRSHRVVPFTACRLQPPVFAQIVDYVIDYINEHHIPAYDEQTHKGLIRHIYLRKGFHTGEIMLCIVAADKKAVKYVREMVSSTDILEKFGDIKCIIVNVNPDNTNVILGRKNFQIYGSENITDVMCGNKIMLSPMSFYQVNTCQAEKLYSIAAGFAELSGNEKILDLYCGTGTIGLSMHDKVKCLTGVEVINQAVENAKINAQINGIENAEFICGDAGTIADKMAAQGEKPDVIIVDPPRKGCDGNTIEAILKMSPCKIVMISCNPATAARDCRMICESGEYEIRKIRGVDLFARTGHVESVVLMSRKGK
ncbi:MAG: 23S rRNA (uracil(1939)-C(5))-methyltransferase RlmD [Oscillospiraceae bacterium]|nr:23S rRNA (uracil(1939)-C(5))-methyltransferase RlmD [Oscillospiraceae bacterium]